MKTILHNLKPTVAKVFLLALILAIIMLVPGKRVATSKVTWNESRGIPLNILLFDVFKGPCSENEVCLEMDVSAVNIFGFLADLIAWYLVVCGLIYVYQQLTKQST